MTQEEKDIIFQDACSRIPYKPYAAYEALEGELVQVQLTGAEYDEEYQYYGYSGDTWGYIPHDNIKLYLRSMSSMTDDEREELSHYENPVQRADFYYSHHIDCRYMIEKGLAIEVTKENNPYACNLS